MEKFIIDFENLMLMIYTESQNSADHIIGEIDKKQIIETLGITDEIVRKELFCAAIIGIDFEEEKAIIYKPVTWDASNGSLYPEKLLKTKKCFIIPEIRNNYNNFLKSLYYEETSTEDILDFVNELLNP